MEDNKKKYIILIGVVVVIIIIFILAKVFKKDNFNERLITYITSKNYVKDTGTMYSFDDKDNPYETCLNSSFDCLGRKYYFNTSTYELVLDEILKSDEVELSFTPTYHYSNKKTSYYYRVSYENGSIVIKGNYSKNNFTCDIEYSYGIKVDDKNIYCDPLRDKLKEFNSYAILLIDDTELLNRMQQKK